MSENNKKSVWKLIIQTIITILTAIGTSLGVTSCIYGAGTRGCVKSPIYSVCVLAVPDQVRDRQDTLKR